MKRVRRFALAGVVAWVLLSLLAGEILIQPGRWNPPQTLSLPGVHTEQLELRIDGLRIEGWALTPPAESGPPRGTLLLLHGLGEARRVIDHAHALAQGWRVLSVDTRAHGRSEGWSAGFGWPERAEAHALLQLARERWPHDPCVAWGRSQGAAAFAYALHEERQAGEPPLLDGLVLESCYADIDTAYSNRLELILGSTAWRPVMMLTQGWVTWRAGLDRERMRPVELLPADIPLFLARGAEDPLVSDAEWARFREAAPAAEHMLVPDFAHRPLSESPEFRLRVTAFLERAAAR